jgi:hypothetical protein
MTINLTRCVLLATVFAVFAVPKDAAALSLPAFFDVTSGESLAIDFSYSADPFATSGGSDLLLVNGGGLSNNVTNSVISLYHDGNLLGTFTNSQPNTFALFSSPQNTYMTLPSTVVDLSEIFTGGESEIIFQPVSQGSNWSIDYQLDLLGAAKSANVNSLVQPDSLTASIVPSVPVPGTLWLLLSGLGGLSVTRHRIRFG